MNVHRFTLDELPRVVLPLGKQGEDMATRIEVDVRPWLNEHPEATISLIVTLSNGTQYAAKVDIADGIAAWTITESDTILAGYGWAEWKMDCPEGNTYISRKGRTHLYPKATGNGGGVDVTPYWELNLKNGSAVHSLRGTGSGAENDDYSIGEYATAFGEGTKARGKSSHAEGCFSETDASSMGGHAEGFGTRAVHAGSHAEGYSTISRGMASHAEGTNTQAIASDSHAEGTGTYAGSQSQHVQGSYNVFDSHGKYLHVVGNGTDDRNRSNAHTIDWSGNAWFSGSVEGDGFIVASPDGTRWVLSVDNTGALTVTRA